MTGLEILLLVALLVCTPLGIACGYQIGKAAAYRASIREIARVIDRAHHEIVVKRRQGRFARLEIGVDKLRNVR